MDFAGTMADSLSLKSLFCFTKLYKMEFPKAQI